MNVAYSFDLCGCLFFGTNDILESVCINALKNSKDEKFCGENRASDYCSLIDGNRCVRFGTFG